MEISSVPKAKAAAAAVAGPSILAQVWPWYTSTAQCWAGRWLKRSCDQVLTLDEWISASCVVALVLLWLIWQYPSVNLTKHAHTAAYNNSVLNALTQSGNTGRRVDLIRGAIDDDNDSDDDEQKRDVPNTTYSWSICCLCRRGAGHAHMA